MGIRVYKPTSPARRFMSVLTYEELTKGLPSEGDTVETPSGAGEVLHVNVLRQLVKVGVSQEKGDVVISEFPLDEIRILRHTHRRRPSDDPDEVSSEKQLKELEQDK